MFLFVGWNSCWVIGQKCAFYNGFAGVRPHCFRYVVNFPNNVTLAAKNGMGNDPQVRSANNAIADMVELLCGKVHDRQLAAVYCALSQSAASPLKVGVFKTHGVSSTEHLALTFTLSRNDETGAVTIKYSEPKGFPVKFSWTTTIDVEGKSTTTPMRVEDRADGAR